MKNVVHTKLRAGALQYTIFVSVLVMLVVLALIAMAHLQQQLRLKNQVFGQLVHENTLAFSTLDNQQVLGSTALEHSEISKRSWGLFDLVQVHSKKNKEAHIKTALVAGQNPDKPALYLLDEQQPLVLVGQTRIEGHAILPEKGVKQGSIAGRSYQGLQLIYGSSSKSNTDLPMAKNFISLRAYIDSIQTSNVSSSFELSNGLNQIHSFTQPTQIFYEPGTLVLEELSLSGNCIIRSDTKVVITASAVLKDLIILAPEIEIKDEVRGTFQAFATKTLSVGEKVYLDYPSALVLVQKLGANRQELDREIPLEIKKKTKIKGVVAFLGASPKDVYQTQLLIDKEVTIFGELYCEQNIELKGAVYGSVYARGFIVKEQGSVYKNHLYNTQIVASGLPETYGGISFENTKLTVAKWLY